MPARSKNSCQFTVFVPPHTNSRQCIDSPPVGILEKSPETPVWTKECPAIRLSILQDNKGRNAGPRYVVNICSILAPSANNQLSLTMFDKPRCGLIHSCCYHDSRGPSFLLLLFTFQMLMCENEKVSHLQEFQTHYQQKINECMNHFCSLSSHQTACDR